MVIGLVRNKAATEKKVAEELGERPNVHILHGDLANYASLKEAAAETAKIVGDRGVDYLVGNAGIVPEFDAYGPVSALYVLPLPLPTTTTTWSGCFLMVWTNGRCMKQDQH